MRFIDQVAIVTGAGSGIGRATALRLASEGASVVIADVNDDHGSQVVHELEKLGKKALYVHCDIGSEKDIRNCLENTIATFKRLDVIVNNAAIMSHAPLSETTVEQWDRVITTNLRGVFLMTKLALPHMKGGSIVNISSVHAHETTPNNSPYAASKGGIEAFTRAISLEMKPEILRINCVAPGAINTPMLWNNPNVKSGKEKVEGKVGEPEDIAAAVAYLASSDAKFVHGTTLIVDGGRLAVL